MNFDNFLKENLTVKVYEQLDVLLRESDQDEPKSPHRITKIKNNPRIMDLTELLKLSELLNKTPLWMIENFEAGKDGIDEDVMAAIIATNKISQHES
jgi:hypothetical protein